MTAATQEKLLAELARLAKSSEPRVQAFLEAMLRRHPQLKRGANA